MTYMLHGRLAATTGNGRHLLAIMKEVAHAEPMPGCLLYLVSTDPADEDAVWVTEVWQSEEIAKAALELPEVKAQVDKAMALLDFERISQQRLDAVAGLPGLD